MNASQRHNEIGFAPLAEARRQEVETGPAEAPDGIRVPRGGECAA